jgi:hypothetical protein
MKGRPEEDGVAPLRRTYTRRGHLAVTCAPKERGELVRRLRPRYREALAGDDRRRP